MTEKKKRLMFFIGTLCSGGAERVVSILSNQFAIKGWDVCIVYYYNEAVFYSLNEKVNTVCIETETNSKNAMRNAIWLRRYIRDNADIVISFLTKFNMLALFASLGTNIPVIVSERTDPKRAYNSVLQKVRDFLYVQACAVVAQSYYAKDCFGKKIKNKTYVIMNPVDVGDLKGKALETKKSKTIVSVGRLIPSKNHELLISAFKKITREYPDYKLVIYGEGDYRDILETKARLLGMSGNIILPGNKADVLNCICDAELFVLSSDYEGMPNALIEAMCLGLPVISTRVAGATDVIIDGENGLLVDAGEEKQLVDAMRCMLHNPAFGKKCGNEATELAERLDIKEIIPQWENLVNGVLNSRGRKNE